MRSHNLAEKSSSRRIPFGAEGHPVFVPLTGGHRFERHGYFAVAHFDGGDFGGDAAALIDGDKDDGVGGFDRRRR